MIIYVPIVLYKYKTRIHTFGDNDVVDGVNVPLASICQRQKSTPTLKLNSNI